MQHSAQRGLMPFLTAISLTKTHLKATGETAFEMGV